MSERDSISACAEKLSAEEWRPIPEVEGLYQASSLGNVRRTASGRHVKVRIDKDGYNVCNLTVRQRSLNKRVGRLVLSAFVGPAPSPDHQCNHIDGNKRNDVPTNLEWMTGTENVRHALKAGRFPSRPRLTVAEVQELVALRGVMSAAAAAGLYRTDRRVVQRIWKRAAPEAASGQQAKA